MTRIVFRTDASTAIGSGHVTRCAALAVELAARGAEIVFLCRELSGHYCDWLEQSGFSVERLSGSTVDIDDDIDQCRVILAKRDCVDWLVVDHYGLDSRWESALRPFTHRILVIEDQAKRAHDCDLLLDQNFTNDSVDRYTALLPANTKCLLGLRYALLRAEFALARETQRPARDGQIRRALVCFGGSDPHRHTTATLKALHPIASHLDRIDVVVGSANKDQLAIIAACAKLPQATIHCPAINMASLLADADLAIGAGGMMNWERACVGVPALAFGIAENQRQIVAALIEGGYVAGIADMISPDEARINAWITCLLGNPSLLRGLSARSGTLVDGRGAKRVADTMIPELLTFRPATPSDSANLLCWRNDPAIRSVSLNTLEIDKMKHQTWLSETLSNPHRVLLVAECRSNPAGVVRFDLHPPVARISIYRVPMAPSAGGLIRQSTDWLRMHHPEIRRIRAEVLSNNTSSLSAFRAAGYRDASSNLEIELDIP